MSFLSQVFIPIFIYISIESYIFILSMGYNPILSLFILFLKLFYLWPLSILPNCLCVLSLCPCHLLSTSLNTTRCWAYVLFSLFRLQTQLFLQGALLSFIGESYLETKIWVVDVFIAIGISFLQVFPVDRTRKYM